MVKAVIIVSAIAGVLGIILTLVDIFLASYGDCKITINNDKEITVKGGNNLLVNLFENKLFIPSACGGKATCGLCKVKVLEGAGLILPTERPFFTPAEIKNNMRLSCQVKVKNDLMIEIPEEFLYIKEYKTRVKSIKNLTYDIKEILFELFEPKTIKFKPGQYVQFVIPGTNEFRAYSISSKPSQNTMIELIIRYVPEGLCTTYIFNELKRGDEVRLIGPYGDFYLQEDSTKNVLCIGGGSGFAPLKSIIYTLIEKKSPRKIDLFFGVRAVKDLFYLKEFEELKKQNSNFDYTFALSAPEEGDKWEGEVCFIHIAVDKYYNEDPENTEVYLCGPPIMIDSCIEQVLYKKGIPEENIYYDKFT